MRYSFCTGEIPYLKQNTTMPNKIADHRRRVVYIEEKENWDLLKEVAAYNGLKPAALIRVAVNQLCEKLRDNPKTRFIKPIFE